MHDLIALSCPSCGGQIQVEKNLEKMFCTHCGTQLLLKQAANGLLTPILARDLTASAQLKESQNALIVIEMLKEQIKELDAQANTIQIKFWEWVASRNSADFQLHKLINQYFIKVMGKKQFGELWDRFKVEEKHGAWYMDFEKMAHGYPGLSTLEEYIQFYHFITEPPRNDPMANEMAQALHPLLAIMPVLQEKKIKLQKAVNEMTG